MQTADMSASRILVVEDEPANAALLQAILTREGYRVSCATDGIEALERLAEELPDLIFLDLDLPRLNGYEVCRRVKQSPATRLIPVVILTAQDPYDARLRVWELGADEFATKPLQCVELLTRCQSLLRLKRLTDELETAQSVLFALARAGEAKSPYTQGHAERVSTFALLLADRIGIEEGPREVLRQGALLHDIGKIGIPDAILDKPSSLTPEEFDVIKQHTVLGARIVEPLHSLREMVPLIRWHHERLDGTGYPDGLPGNEIPQIIRILSVADVYDSLASLRPYRAAIPRDACFAILRENALRGGLDPELVEEFVSALLGTPTPTPDQLAATPVPEMDSLCIASTVSPAEMLRVRSRLREKVKE